MKTILFLSLAAFAFAAHAQDEASRLNESPIDHRSTAAPYSVIERGAHHRVWASVTWETNKLGWGVARTNSYTELATGMHYLSEKSEWTESREEIEILPKDAGAVARQGQHKVIFPPDIYDGAIQMYLPDGQCLRSRVLGLSYYDVASGKSVLIAETTNSVGELHGRNVVIYPDVFTDFRASLRLTYTKSGFEQDIIMMEQPPSCKEWGMDPATTKLQVLTEFFDPPQPSKRELPVTDSKGNSVLDELLDFPGNIQMGFGKAFSLMSGASAEEIPVQKQWLKMEGRDFLVEQVEVSAIEKELELLPRGASLSPGTNAVRTVRLGNPSLPTRRQASTTNKPMRMAQVTASARAFVLDYLLTLNTSSQSNYVFKGDTTYYLSGNVILYGTNTTFEGGTVLKYTNNVTLTVNAPVSWLADSYRPVIMVARDDNSVGETISGSSGNPSTNFYAASALYFNAAVANTNLVLRNLRVANATRGIAINTRAGHVLSHVQLLNCAYGLALTNAEVSLRNALMYLVRTNFTGSSSTGRVEHLTSHQTTRINGNIGANLFITNSLFAAATTTNTSTFTSVNNRTNSASTGIFTNVGAGFHYLVTGSTNRNVGTTNINAALLAELKKLTTYPPLVYSNLTFSTATNFNPQLGIRDTSTNDLPDIGYHYDPLDYVFNNVTLSASLTLTNGVAIGLMGSYGLNLASGSALQSITVPPMLNRVVRYSTAQEQATTGLGGSTFLQLAASSYPNLDFRFTDFMLGQGNQGMWIDVQGTFRFASLTLRDCQARNSIVTVAQGTQAASTVALTNNIFERCAITFYPHTYGSGYFSPIYLRCYNNLFRGGNANIWFSTPIETTFNWLIQDNLFDGTSLYFSDPTGGYLVTCSHNGFTSGTSNPLGGSNNKTGLLADYQNGSLGGFYYPASGGASSLAALIGAGSRNADAAGLYHYTTTTNQVKETNSVVDIGFHYVAVNASGQPYDFDGDGVPDYVEDANGNGTVDAGETEWRVVITNQPQSQAIVAGNSVTFTVGATGTPLYYQWLFNGTNAIAGATSSSYTISSVAATNAGVYSVIVSNANGMVVSSNATLTVTCLSASSGLAAWWQAESNAVDTIGGLAGTLSSGASYTTGQAGTAFRFDGTNGVVQIPDSPTLCPTNFTIETWVKFDSLDSARSGGAWAGIQLMLLKQTPTNTDWGSFSLDKNRTGNGTGNGDYFEFNVTSATGSNIWIQSSPTIQTGVWYHVAGVRGSNYIQLYVNGQFIAQSNAFTAQSYGYQPLQLGSSGNTAFDGKLKGSLDEIGLYHRVLSSNEIAAIYKAGSVGRCPPPLSIAVVNPANGDTLISPVQPTLSARVLGQLGVVANVAFFSNGNKIGDSASGTNGYYSLVWTNPPATNGALTAVVTDNSGINTTSPVVNVTITAGSFVKGINLNGVAVSIEGNQWLSYQAATNAGLTISTNVTTAVRTNVWLVPPGDTNVQHMLQTMLIRQRLPSTNVPTQFIYSKPSAYDRLATLTNVPPGYTVTNLQYRAWCVEYGTLDPTGFYSASSYYSYGAPDPRFPHRSYNQVNYILNNKTNASLRDIQLAIWTVLGTDPSVFGSPDNLATYQQLTNNATLYGADFVPGPNQISGVILEATNTAMAQPILIEIQGTNKPISFTLSQTLTNGSYSTYLWLAEHEASHVHALDVKLQGTTVATNIGDLELAQWRKFGPYAASVTNGVLTMEIISPAKGDPLLMGLTIHTTNSVVTDQLTVAIVSPTNNHSMLARDTVAISASAFSASTNITWVQFFAGTNSASSNALGYAVSPNANGLFAVDWTPIGGGTYTLTAKAADSRGSNAISAPVTVTVRSRPTVIITNPVSETVLGPALFNVAINANASATGATITNVSYYHGTNFIASSASAPSYGITWSNVAAGNYTLTARATDSTGATAASHPVEIQVIAANQRPVVDAGSDTTIRLPNSVLLAGLVSDDGLPLASPVAIRWTNIAKPSGSQVTFGNENEAVTTATFSKVGFYTNRLEASDGQLDTNDLMVVEVLATNLPPIVNPGTSRVLYDAMAVQLQGWAEDDGQPDNGLLTTGWRLVSGPGTVFFADSSRTNTTAVFSERGNYVLELAATDGELTTRSNLAVTLVLVTNLVSYGSGGDYLILTNNGYEFFYEHFWSNAFYASVTNLAAFTNEFQTLYTNFYALDYNDASFVPGQAAFANSNGPCAAYPHSTEWPVQTTLLVRKWFVVPPGTTNLSLAFTIDDGLVLFLNGRFYGYNHFNECPVLDSVVFNNIPSTNWHEGTNLLAVCAWDVDTQTFLDFKIGANVQYEGPTNHLPEVIILSPDMYVEADETVDLVGLIADIDKKENGQGGVRWDKGGLGEEVYFDYNGTRFTNSTDYVSFTNFLVFPVTVQFSQPGEYNLRLVSREFYWAYDSVNVVVYEPTNVPPTVTLTSPASNSNFSADAPIPISATVAAGSGTITNVEFYARSTNGLWLIGRATASPYATTWLPAIPGVYTLKAKACDDGGLIGMSPPVTITIAAGNHSPIANTDQPIILANSQFNVFNDLLHNDSDDDGDPLTIVEVYPATKAEIIDGGKALLYTPPVGPGWPRDGFSYRISDGRGGTDWGSVLVYAYASEMPQVVIVDPPSGYETNAGAVTPIKAYVEPSEFITHVEFVRNGFVLGVVSNGVNGVYTLNWPATRKDCGCGITATAYDHFGQVNTSAPITINVTHNPADGEPISSLLVYTNGSGSLPFTNLVTIRDGFFGIYGHAFHNLGSSVSWQLDLLATDGTLIRNLTKSTAAVGTLSASNFLASCDLSTVENGIYDMRLTVIGGYVETNTTVRFVLDSNLKIGQFSFSQQDLVIPVSGIPLTVVRTYNSLNPRRGAFGYGWTHAINDLDVVLNEERDGETVGWPLDVEDAPAQWFSQRVGGDRDVTLTLPDGQRTTFYFYLEGPMSCTGNGYDSYCYKARWQAPPGSNWGLEAQGNNTLNGVLDAWGTGNIFWEAGDSRLPMDYFDFLGFVLTNRDGTAYYLDRDEQGEFAVLTLEGSNYVVTAYGPPRLTRIVQRTGDTIHISDDAIIHTNPTDGITRRVVFQRNSAGLITGISDPNGLNSSGETNGPLAVKYEYDNRENLRNVLQLVDRAAATYVTSSFSYTNRNHPHYITGITDPRGITVARNEYDDDGRLTAVIDADGKRTEFGHDINGRFERVIDRGGGTNTYVYDLRGNVTFITNALGVITRMQYDDKNQKTNEVNTLGTPQETWRLAYYDHRGYQTNIITSPDHTNSFRYDDYGNLLWHRDPVGNITTNGYDGSGNLINTAQLNSNNEPVAWTSSIYDGNGHLVATLNANNKTNASFIYDNSGNLTDTTDANGVTRHFGYDANGNQTNSWYVFNGSNIVSTTIYDAQGRAVEAIDPLGNTNSTYYNAFGKVDHSVDKFGNTNSFLYDTRGNLIRTTHADGLVTYTVYDDAGRAFFTTDRNGITATHTYFDAAGRATNVVRVTNAVVTMDAGPRTVLTFGGYPISTNSTEYFDNGWVKKRVGPDGQPTTYAYWPDGQTMYVTNVFSTNVTFYKYDIAGRQEYVSDALNHTNRFEYDAAGRMFKTTFHDGTYTSNYFNTLGQRTVVRDQAGLLTQFGYDTSGQLTNVIKPSVIDGVTGNPATPIWSYTYDAYGRLTVTTDPRNNGTTNSYDAYGREVSHWLAGGGAGTTNFYNSLGQLTNQIDFKGQQKQTRYDRFGRVTNHYYFATPTSAYPSNAVSYRYNHLGQLTNITERTGTEAANGYVASLSRPGSRGRFAALLASLNRIPPGAQGGSAALLLCAFALVCIPREKRRQFALCLVEAWRVQWPFSSSTGEKVAASQMRCRIPLPSVICHLPISLVALCSHAASVFACGGSPDGTPKRFRLPSYGWRFATLVTLIALIGCDPSLDGLWTARAACVDPGSTGSTLTTRITTFSYDLEGRLAQVNSPEGYINYEYDLATGQHVRTCTANSESTYEYDALGRLWKVHAIRRNNATINETTIYTYTAVGSRDTVTLPNNTVTAYKYDELNRLTNLTHTASGGALLASYSYKVDSTGRRTNAVEVLLDTNDSTRTTNTIIWQYDGLYRLTNEVQTSTSSTTALTHSSSYQYDKAGNRWKKIDVVGGTTTTITNQYNANDQLLKEVTLVGGAPTATNTYLYDANGSVIARTNIASGGTGVALYSYDLKNKLNSVASFNGIWTTNQFEYNEQGIRVRTVTGGSTKYFLVDGNNHTGYAQVLEELNAVGGSPSRSYVLGDDVLAQCGTDKDDPAYLLYDGHGSTRHTVHGTASVGEQYNYDAYGVSLTTLSNPETPMLYCGEQYDSTLNMYNLRARYYNPATGTFNQRDTFAGINSDPQSLHKYAYANCDPVNGIDPSGQWTILEVAIVVAIGAIVSGLISGTIAHFTGGSFAEGFAKGMISGGLTTLLAVLGMPLPWAMAFGSAVAQFVVEWRVNGQLDSTAAATRIAVAFIMGFLGGALLNKVPILAANREELASVMASLNLQSGINVLAEELAKMGVKGITLGIVSRMINLTIKLAESAYEAVKSLGGERAIRIRKQLAEALSDPVVETQEIDLG